MKTTLAFDVYGTLIDTNGVVKLLETFMQDKAHAFSAMWRDKQLEYSFRRGHMQNYVSFSVCTQQALEYTCLYYKVPLDETQKQQLLSLYAILPAFDEVKEALQQLKSKGFRLFAFSNGTKQAVEKLLEHAEVKELFLDVVSVDDIKTFKPSPAAYSYFLRNAQAKSGASWLISSNPFDVIGAISAGMQSAWIQRSPDAVFDPWEIQPTLKAHSLVDLVDKLTQ